MPPILSPTDGLTRLQQLDERAERLASTEVESAQLAAFNATLKATLTDTFGNNSEWIARVISAGVVHRFVATDAYQRMLDRRTELRGKRLMLEEAMQYLRTSPGRTTADQTENTSLEKLEIILQRFHRVALRLRNRHDERPTLAITDEYDVQDLLHALLLVSFSDVRDEEPGPSHAGGRPRFDFLLKEEQIVIEVKKTRPSLTHRDLNDELIADIARYQAHPDCKTLVCFVYDPDHRIPNVAGFIRDLERTASKMPVRVVVVPVG
ncbi:hypothetical protein HPC50_19785 [Corallococcus exiguus]|uniref:PD-(D/E)XK nuclease domain-containing protein n=1 Tax=Corallococcus TaxID=83461 RepID=UPI0011C34AF5|nr:MULTISPECIES: hypothetical protein [Corallococcus]NPC49305.1 hypothetical protein [Corallococcus exiguus]